MVPDFFRTYRRTSIALGGVAVLLIGGVLLAAFFDWNRLRPTVARLITAKTGRAAAINGNLVVHLLSWTPSAEVNEVTLRNPDWAERDLMFSAKQVTVSISLGRLLRGQWVIPELDLVAPVVNLERDAGGRASWSLGEPSGKPKPDTTPFKIPTIRRLIVQNGELHVVDRIRKLKFGGSLTAADQAGKSNDSAFKLHANGALNGKPFSLDANGGALLDLSPETPYSFTSHIRASDIQLDMHVTVQEPFDLSRLTVGFDISGKDLADVYYLTGLALPDTPPYRLSASVAVDGTTYRIENLQGRVGGSDLRGTAEVVNQPPRPKFTASLTSHLLDLADVAPTLGRPATAGPSLAAGEPPAKRSARQNTAPPTQASATLLPDADLQVDRVRGMDADVRFNAAAVTAPKVPMKTVNFQLLLDDGVLTLDPLSFVLDQGKFAGTVRIDARQTEPVSDIDMHMDDVDLAQFKTKAMRDPPLTGTLSGRLKVHGAGSSIHKLASNADAGFSAVIPHGEMTRGLAELTGINVLQGLGLLLGKDETKTEIRCGVMDFQAHQGVLTAETLFVDTSNVLIKGKGNVNLSTEALDFEIQGDPKKMRFARVRSPITVDGTLQHPAIGINVKKLAAQGAVASALGILLTPVAAALAFIDPGLAKNKDCGAALSAAPLASLE